MRGIAVDEVDTEPSAASQTHLQEVEQEPYYYNIEENLHPEDFHGWNLEKTREFWFGE